MFSRIYYFLLASAVMCFAGGFALLLWLHIISPWGVVSRIKPSTISIICVLIWLGLSNLLAYLSFMRGIAEAKSSPQKEQNLVTVTVLVALTCVWTILIIGGFASKYIYPLLHVHPPNASLILGLPIVVLSALLVALCAFTAWSRSRKKVAAGSVPSKLPGASASQSNEGQTVKFKKRKGKRA